MITYSLLGAGAAFSLASLVFPRHQDGMSVAELENFALTSQKGSKINLGDHKTQRQSSPLIDYEFGLGIDVRQITKDMVDSYRELGITRPLIVGDVGGSYGTAIADLAKECAIEPFVIDVFNHATPNGALPENRHIIKGIEDTGLRDGTFDMLISYNSSEYFDMAKALPEMYRLLRPGGILIYDIVENTQTDGLSSLRAFPFPQHGIIKVVAGNKMCTMTIPDYFKWYDERVAPSKERESLELMLRYSVMIERLGENDSIPSMKLTWRPYPPEKIMTRQMEAWSAKDSRNE